MNAAGAVDPARRKAEEALELVPDWRGRQPHVVRPLGGGPTNDAWLVACGSQRYVLRLDTPLTQVLRLDRAAEVRVVAAAAAAGIAPRIVHAAPAQGLLVTGFLPGRSWRAADLDSGANLQRLAAVLRRLHALTPAVRRFEPGAAIAAYAQQLGTGSRPCAELRAPAPRDPGAPVPGATPAAPPTSAQVSGWAATARALLDALEPVPLALCHNDLVAANIIDGAGTLRLIDWEYAGLGDPYFDLAVVVRHHDLGPEQRALLLEAYQGRVGEQERARLRDYCRIYDRLVLLWLAVLARSAPLDAGQQALWSRALSRCHGDGPAAAGP